MKLKKVHTVILLLFFFCVQHVFAQTAADASLKELKLIYQKFKMTGSSSVPEGKTYYFNYTVRTATRDSLDTGVFTSDISIWASGKSMQVKSREMEMYQNPDDAFIVLPGQKQLVRLDPYYKKEKDDNALKSQIIMIQDTLFALSKVLKSETKNDSKTIVLQVNEKGRRLLNASRVTFVINTKEQELEKIKIDYEKGSGHFENVVYVEYKFNEINYDCKGKSLNENLSRKFLRSSQEPSERYKGYSLVDNRQKKNTGSGKQWK